MLFLQEDFFFTITFLVLMGLLILIFYLITTSQTDMLEQKLLLEGKEGKTSSIFGIIAVVIGVIGFLIFGIFFSDVFFFGVFFFGALAITFGVLGRKKDYKKGMSTFGLVLGVFDIVWFFLYIFIIPLIPITT